MAKSVFLRAMGVLAAGILTTATPALSAQTGEISMPPSPFPEPKELGQALQELKEDRSRVPLEILDYDIPEDERSDVSSCNSVVSQDLFTVYKTCWPVLQSYKDLIRLNALKQNARRAYEKEISESVYYLEHALRLADKMIADIPNNEWPLQTRNGYGAYQVKFELLRIFGRSDEALKTINSYLRDQKNSPLYRAKVSRAYIFADRTRFLLEAGRRKEARRLFQTALNEDKGFDQIAFNEHAEILMHDAIISGDDDYALALFDDYVPRVRIDDDWFDRVSVNLKYFKIYVLAGRGDVDGVLAQIAAMDGIWRANKPCQTSDNAEYYFPLVVHPLEKDPRVKAALRKSGCTEETIISISTQMKDGLNASYGIRPLPPRTAP